MGLLLALTLSIAALLSYLGRRGQGEVAVVRAGGTCWVGAHADADRAGRIASLLGGTVRGGPLGEPLGSQTLVCFDPASGSALVEGGMVVLDDAAGDAENAARLGHLLAHRSALAALPDFRDASRPCDAVVDDALVAEARAYALELELRRELGVTDPRRVLPFEGQVRALEPSEREERIRAYLAAHPDGEAQLPGLARAYRNRCEGGRPRGGPRSPPEPEAHGRSDR